MDAREIFLGHREETQRIGVAQIGFRSEREAREVAQGLQLIGMHAGIVELLPVARIAGIGMRERPAQPLQLQCAQFGERCRFDRIQRHRQTAFIVSKS